MPSGIPEFPFCRHFRPTFGPRDWATRHTFASEQATTSAELQALYESGSDGTRTLVRHPSRSGVDCRGGPVCPASLSNPEGPQIRKSRLQGFVFRDASDWASADSTRLFESGAALGAEGQLDKLGVTGSSPVPPTRKSLRIRLILVPRWATLRAVWQQSNRRPGTRRGRKGGFERTGANGRERRQRSPAS